MKTKKIEVLAPAGNPAALKAAVFAGADAVYMGGSLFSARASAGNFSREEMRKRCFLPASAMCACTSRLTRF